LSVGASLWLYLAVRIGDFGLASDRPDVPRVIGVLGLLALAAAAAARIPRFQTFTWGGARGRRQGHS